MTNIRKKMKLYTLLSVFAFAAIVLGAGAIGSHDAMAEDATSEKYTVAGDAEHPATAEPKFSVTVPEVNALEITLPSRLVPLDVSPTPNTPSFNNTDPLVITVGTTNETGYTLTMTPVYNNVVTSNLTRTESINGETAPVIETLAAKDGGYTLSEFQNSSSTVNAWGYKYSTDRAPETNFLSVEAATVKLNEYFSPVDNDLTTMVLAAKVNALKPAGEYQTTLKFTATANPVTYAINFNRGRAASSVTVPDALTGAMNSAATTKVSLNGSEPGAWTGYAFTGWCSVEPTLNGNSDECPATANSYSSSSEVTMAPDKDIITLYAMWSVRSFGINIKSSTGIASVVLSKDGTQVCKAETTSSVSCGNLPYGTTYDLVATPSTGYSFNGWTLDPNDGTLGNATKTGATTTFTVGTQGTLISPSAELNSYTVTVTFAGVGLNSVTFSNATYGTVTATNNNQGGAGTGTASLKYNVPYTATANFASNNEIASWAQGTNTGVSATGATNPITVTLNGAGNGTLTVTGKSSKLYMQGLNGASCVTGSTTTAYDSRDEQAYSIRRLSDGKCWMITNLNLAGGTTVEPTKSDMTSGSYTLNNSTKSGFNSDTGNFVFNTGNKTNTCTGDGCWSYYSWCAATAGSCSSATTKGAIASASICPKGWKLPTAGPHDGAYTSSDTYKLATAYGMATGNYYENSGTFYNNAGPGTTPNFLLTGYYGNGSLGNGGSNGIYWSRTSYSSTLAYYLYFNSGYVSSANNGNRRHGMAVRCVLAE